MPTSNNERFLQTRLAAYSLPVILLAMLVPSFAAVADETKIKVPKGFVSLLNGRDLAGWRGLSHEDPRRLKAMKAEDRAEKQRRDNKDLTEHWRAEDNQIVNDGHGVYLTTVKDYGDFELLLDWKMVVPGADSGIYLRGSPQVQIWDPHNKEESENGAHRGSGALWNNNPGSPGRFPLVKADHPIGEWNTLRIKMIGDRVTVHFNNQLVVDNAVMHNYFDRASPMFATGPIQFQTHGGEMRFRNIFLREIK